MTPAASTAGPAPPLALPPDLDPALPGLAGGLDPAQMLRRFESEAGCGPAPIATCTREHIKWTPGQECIATYRLRHAPGPASPSTVGVVEIGRDTVAVRLFVADPRLPGLAAATDSGEMSRWFAQTYRRPVETCRADPVTYRAGQRCVLRYHVSGPRHGVADAGNATAYGKVLAGGEAERMAATMTALGPTLVASVVGLAAPWQLVVTEDAGSRHLATVVASGPGPAAPALAAAGRTLARLHSRPGPAGPQRSLLDDADELTGYLPAAARISAPVSRRLGEAIERLRAVAGHHGPPVASHGAFRLDQVVLTERGPRLIDLDSYCWAEPSRDIANLLAYLQWRVIRGATTGSEMAHVRAAFLAGYTNQDAVPLDRPRIAVYQAASLLKIAGRRYRALATHEWDRIPELVAAALELLAAPAGATP